MSLTMGGGGHRPPEQGIGGQARSAGTKDLANGHEDASRHRVAIIGSGNWGCVAARLVAFNTARLESFHDEVRMWVYEELLPTGEKLSDNINRTNENLKYLPGIKLGVNVIPDPDLEHAVEQANMLVFVTPHQFVEGICKRLIGRIRHNAQAISLIKGMEVKTEGTWMISKLISNVLGINCCVLMGANLANEIAEEKFSEATVGYRGDGEIAQRWVQLFSTPYFLVSAVQDIEGVELCGTLKNVVAIAAGLVDGLDMGNNTKAAIMRIGLREMLAFSKLLFPSVKDSTFLESCGIADLITTCFGGRNRKVAEAFARCGGKRSFDELEAELLQGQKLQAFYNQLRRIYSGTTGNLDMVGTILSKHFEATKQQNLICVITNSNTEKTTREIHMGAVINIWKEAGNNRNLFLIKEILKGVSTAKELYEVLGHRGLQGFFPLFTTVHEICIGHLPPSALVECSSEMTSKFPHDEDSAQL